MRRELLSLVAGLWIAAACGAGENPYEAAARCDEVLDEGNACLRQNTQVDCDRSEELLEEHLAKFREEEGEPGPRVREILQDARARGEKDRPCVKRCAVYAYSRWTARRSEEYWDCVDTKFEYLQRKATVPNSSRRARVSTRSIESAEKAEKRPAEGTAAAAAAADCEARWPEDQEQRKSCELDSMTLVVCHADDLAPTIDQYPNLKSHLEQGKPRGGIADAVRADCGGIWPDDEEQQKKCLFGGMGILECYDAPALEDYPMLRAVLERS